MCLAIPGKILEINGENALIGYGPEKRKAKIVGVKAKVGEYVIVQGGVIALKVGKEEAEKALSFASSL